MPCGETVNVAGTNVTQFAAERGSVPGAARLFVGCRIEPQVGDATAHRDRCIALIRYVKFELQHLLRPEGGPDLGWRQSQRLYEGSARRQRHRQPEAGERPDAAPHGMTNVNVTVALSLPVNALAPLAFDTNRPRYRVTVTPDAAEVSAVGVDEDLDNAAKPRRHSSRATRAATDVRSRC